MKIVSLQAENVKRLKAVEIRPDGSLVVIGGRNAAGKTSVLDSIEMALGGGESIPPKPIREGSARARIVADLGDIVVTRSFTKSGSYLDITNKDGSKPKSPQALLDSLVGRLSFDPLGFTRLKREERTETLKKLVGLDFSDLDAAATRAYEERQTLNRDLKRARALHDGTAAWPDAPKEEANIAELTAKWQAAVRHNQHREALIIAAKQAATEADTALLQATRAEKALEQAREAAKLAVGRRESARAACEAAPPMIESAAKDALDGAEEVNRKVRANKERRRLAAECSEIQAKADALTAAIDKAQEERVARLGAAKWPIDGLAVDAGDVTYRGIPFEQCSGAEQLKVSVAMGLALNPTLRVLLIRDGSLLDDESMATLAEMAEKGGAQVWIERVGDKDKCAVIIEDGAVKE